MDEATRPIPVHREGGIGNSAGQFLARRRRSGTDAARRQRCHSDADGPHHPAYTRAKTADDRCAGCAQRHSARTLRGQSSAQCAQCAGRAARRHGIRPIEHFRRPSQHACPGAVGQRRASLQSVSHCGVMLAHAHCAADGPQPPYEQYGRYRRGRDSVSWQYRRQTKRHRAPGRDASSKRVRNGGVRQVSRDSPMGGQPCRTVRSLAHPLGL